MWPADFVFGLRFSKEQNHVDEKDHDQEGPEDRCQDCEEGSGEEDGREARRPTEYRRQAQRPRRGGEGAGGIGRTDDVEGNDRRDGDQGVLDEPRRQDPAGHAVRRHPAGDSDQGGEARFTKTERGHFALGTGTNAPAKPTAKATGKKAAKKKTDQTEIADGTPGPKAVSELFKI